MSDSNSPNDSQDSTKIDIRRLSTINKLADVGMDGVSDSIGMLGGDDVTMEFRRTDFLNLVDRHSDLPDETAVGIRARLKDAPNGHLLVLFSQKDAQKITRIMLSDVVDDMSDVSNEMAQSAAEDLGQMMVSGFIDGWADAFSRTIDHSTPDLVHSTQAEIVKRTATIDDNPLAVQFEAEIQTEATTISTDVYLFPDMAQFVKMVNSVGDS